MDHADHQLSQKLDPFEQVVEELAGSVEQRRQAELAEEARKKREIEEKARKFREKAE